VAGTNVHTFVYMHICVFVYLKDVEGLERRRDDSGVQFLKKLFLASVSPHHLTMCLRQKERNRRGRGKSKAFKE